MKNNSKKIIVVEATSTGIYFVEDCRNLGFEPIVLELFHTDEQIMHNREFYYKKFDDNPPKIIRELEDYQSTLELVKDINPCLIVPGYDAAVELANKLAYDLNLPCNNPDSLAKSTNKLLMQNALKDANIRCIETGKVDSCEEAMEFFSKLEKPIYLKPVRGAGSVDACCCTNQNEITDYFRSIDKSKKNGGNLNRGIIAQEYISGPEYIVNTVVSNGQSRVVSAWKYKKIQLKGGVNVYDNMMSISSDEINKKYSDLFKYALNVNKALGLSYGAVHGEFLIDDNGPVLIETNCRPQGSGRPPVFTDKIFKHHETDLILNSYLYPKKIDFSNPAYYESCDYGCVKYVISPYDLDCSETPILDILEKLPSFVCQYGVTKDQHKFIPKTTSLFSSCCTIFLAHHNKEQVINDYNVLRDLEKNHFDKLFC